MATVIKFEDLEIWKMARDQAREIFELTRNGFFNSDLALKDQINSASGSVMDNIAEGFDRAGNKEFSNFLIIAKGSNGEVRSQLYRALDRHYLSPEIFEKIRNRNEILDFKIRAFLNYLRNSEFKGQRYKTLLK